ncbi:hypothetical protein KSS87_013162 [Heliosperma pusillum]|nr:hypothetical protein KSS87_013162 [Heliosperma pusillum]
MLVVSFVGGLPPRWLRLHNILCHKKVNVISWMVDTVLRESKLDMPVVGFEDSGWRSLLRQ